MKVWQQELETRWESVRSKGRTLGWHAADSPHMSTLAAQSGMRWYEARGDDRVGDFMAHDAHGLFNNLCSFGRIKCQHLIEVLEAASAAVEVSTTSSADAGRAFTLNCSEVLELWGVPSDYPLHLLPLGTRLMNFCEAQGITTLSGLLEAWSSLGRAGLLAHENIGKRTVDELQDFAQAIASADATVVRRWLPLNEAETGLCLRRLLALSFGMLSPTVVAILMRRLVDKLTLEEVGEEHGMTRERVRQLEAAYLRDVGAILDFFAQERAAMIEAWMEGREWQGRVLPQNSREAVTLILAGIEACFTNSGQGMARRLADEAAMQSWLESLLSHADLHLGGVELQAFLDATVPVERQTDFLMQLAASRGVVVDQTSGLVKPSSPCVRDAMCAILAQEEAPIPLTWLAIRVQGIEGCAEGDADFILRNRYRWSQLGFLDLAKVLWNQ
jgi:hypothetical protein